MDAQPPVPSSPAPRRIAAPKWLDIRLVLGVVLVLAAVLIGAEVVSSAGRTYATVAVTHDLAAGTVVGSADVHLAQVRLPDHGRGTYLVRLDDAVGKQLNRAVAAGELLPAAAVATAKPETTVTVPFASGTAPELRKGRRIEVWMSTPRCSSLVLLPDVTVQAVQADNDGSFSSGTGGQDVVISVSPPLADRVVAALALTDVQLRAGALDGVRSTPAGGALPDLQPCANPSAGR
jgi:SAF domain